MKICYITAQTPWGKGETFILEEMLEIKNQGTDLLIIPRNPPKEIFHKEANKLLENAIWLPLINWGMIIGFLKTLLTKSILWKTLGVIIIKSRSPWIFIKNLTVLPKGVFIAKIIQKENINHIHAHWGSTTATMAYIISQITNVSWSLTLHRWDIKENNILEEKVKSAKFLRCISKHGVGELLNIIGEKYKKKVQVIHLGVRIPKIFKSKRGGNNYKKFTIVIPANLFEVKGHKYSIEAISILVKKGIKDFQSIFYGGGPLKVKLKNLIKEKKLTNYIKMPGPIPHEKLIEIYRNREIDTVVLPSITTDKDEHEGIPVSLMEAMAYGIPVISTNTGGIPELLSNNVGIIVKEKSPKQLAEAIIKLMKKDGFVEQLSKNAHRRVQYEFNIEKNVKILLNIIQNII